MLALLLPGLPLDAAASHVATDHSLRGVVAMPREVPAGGAVVIEVELERPDGTPAADLRVRAELFHGFGRRRVVHLAPDGPGRYAARVTLGDTRGLWQGVLRVEGGPRALVADLAFTVRPGPAPEAPRVPRPLGFRRAGPWTAPPWLDHLVAAGLYGTLAVAAVALARRPLPAAASRPTPLAVPGWTTPVGTAAAAAGGVGAYWDVAWHVDRGRETFWSPPHLLIYAGILVVVATVAVTVVRARGRGAAGTPRPLRFTLVAGTLTLASAPFDEGWHALFGLDVSIWSPPHLVLLFGASFATLGLALLEAERGTGPEASHGGVRPARAGGSSGSAAAREAAAASAGGSAAGAAAAGPPGPGCGLQAGRAAGDAAAPGGGSPSAGRWAAAAAGEGCGGRPWAVALLAGTALFIVEIFVLEWEFALLERWHVLLARPRGLYLLSAVTLAILVLASGAAAGGRGIATAAAASGWGLRAAVSLLVLPALGRTAPGLVPFYPLSGLTLDAALALGPGRRRPAAGFAAAGALAALATVLAHNALAVRLGGRVLAPGDLWPWLPAAVLAGAAAGVVGLHIGRLARPVAGSPVGRRAAPGVAGGLRP